MEFFYSQTSKGGISGRDNMSTSGFFRAQIFLLFTSSTTRVQFSSPIDLVAQTAWSSILVLVLVFVFASR